MEWSRYTIRIKETGRSRWPADVPVVENWLPYFSVPDFDLICIVQGRARYRLTQGWVWAGPGMCLLLRPGQRYNARQDQRDPLTSYFTHFEIEDASGRSVRPTAELPPELIHPTDAEITGIVFRRIVELTFGFSSVGFALPARASAAAELAAALLKTLLMDLDMGASMAVGLPKKRRLIREAAGHIMESPQDIRCLDALARDLGCGKEHVARLFRQETGYAPQQFIIRARIQAAQRLLRFTTEPIGEIAASLGYQGAAFFARQFKAVAGLSPGEYRRRAAAPVETCRILKLRPNPFASKDCRMFCKFALHSSSSDARLWTCNHTPSVDSCNHLTARSFCSDLGASGRAPG